jgi:hypothetical protein
MENYVKVDEKRNRETLRSEARLWEADEVVQERNISELWMTVLTATIGMVPDVVTAQE